ncbi:MAG: ankryin [Candidatus Omnitrophica bacterium]|nr:ankryin [Candidatus Omnitrophota bacterium]
MRKEINITKEILRKACLLSLMVVLLFAAGTAYADSLLEAAERGDAAAVSSFLNNGVDPDTRDQQYGMTALMVSAAEGHKEVVKILLAAKADVNLKDWNLGASVLMGAAEYGYPDIIELLISSGADVNARDKRGFTALEQAATKGYLEAVKLLIANKADVNAQDSKYGANALMGAAANGHKAIVEFLLIHGANPGLKANNGFTASDFARQKGHYDILQLLNK